MSDRIFGVVALVLAGAYAWVASGFEVTMLMVADPLGPRTFPYLLAILLAVAAVYLLWRPDPDPQWPDVRRLVQMVLIVLLFIVYTFFLESLGFILTTVIAVTILSWRLGAKPMIAVGNGVAVALVLFGLFDLVLGLPLPLGLLEVG